MAQNDEQENNQIKKKDEDFFDKTRMSFGDHLMELRSRMIKSICGFLVAFIVCMCFAKHILGFITVPLMVALEASGHEQQLVTTSLQAPFMMWIKISLFGGLFLGSPWIFYQLWGFVSAGLYPSERRYVNVFVPFAAALFIMGGMFFIVIVAPISFNFFITFNNKLTAPAFSEKSSYHKFVSKILIKDDKVADSTGPDHFSDGDEDKSPVSTDTNTDADKESGSNPLAKPLLTLTEYVSLVIVLSLAFGVAFQMPLAVFLLGRLSIIKLESFKTTRKYVLLGIVILAAIMTPGPDVVLQVLLAIPMYILYELGIVMLTFWPKRQ